MDLTKAFDSVVHEKLLDKLESVGFRGVIIGWLRSYLIGREQCVVAFDKDGKLIRSNWRTTSLGVPQGTILGGLMFLLYINDLADATENSTIMFADDTTIIARGPMSTGVADSITRDLGSLKEWFAVHNLQLNIQKTNLLNFDLTSQGSMVKYGDEVLTCSDEASFLGWIVDKKLSWNSHIEHLARKISRFSYALRTISSAVGVGAATCAYYANVHSLLKYGVMFWGRSVECTRIFKLQKTCIRAMFSLSHLESCKGHFKRNKILTLYAIYILEIAIFVKTNYIEFFQKHENNHTHNTRASNFLLPPATHLTRMQKTMLYQCMKVYNHIPSKWKTLPLLAFKSKLKQILVDRVLYSIDDFFNMSL